MRCRFALAVISLSAVFAPTVCAQSPDAVERPAKTPIPTEGFWPTKTLLARVFDRMSEAIGDEYQLDDEQRARFRELVEKRFGAFLEDNRGEIQTLTNQFFEAQMSDQPPTTEDMATWSSRVLPLMEKFHDVIGGLADTMKEVLTDDQTIKLEAEYSAFETGIRMVNGKLGDWSVGRFDPKSEWFSPGMARKQAQERERQRMEAEMDAARQAKLQELGYAQGDASGEASPDPSKPGGRTPGLRRAASRPVLDEWARYTESFNKRYDLDADQRQKAEAFLKAKQTERDAYLQRKSFDIDKITKQALDAKTDEEKRAAKDASDKLNRPVERMFQQLKDKLDTLPTRAQRQKAAAAESKPAASEPAGSGN